MSRLNWNPQGSRFFETGVDRGVLYPKNSPGVAWVGLSEVSENPTGGDARPFWLDGVKYANVAAAEEFEASVRAYSSPPEFNVCEGISSIQNGLFATQQPRQAFNFSYRTLIGNDTDGVDHGYKIHLVYGALAAPASRTNTTFSSDSNPMMLNWNFTTLPPIVSGRKPTAHFIIDSRLTPLVLLVEVEDILYGTEAWVPRIPLVPELITIFQNA